MTTNELTSPEAVERLAAHVQSTCGCALGPNAEQSVARTLRALSDERERLLAALRRIAGKGDQVYCRDGHEECALLARAALAPEPRA